MFRNTCSFRSLPRNTAGPKLFYFEETRNFYCFQNKYDKAIPFCVLNEVYTSETLLLGLKELTPHGTSESADLG